MVNVIHPKLANIVCMFSRDPFPLAGVVVQDSKSHMSFFSIGGDIGTLSFWFTFSHIFLSSLLTLNSNVEFVLLILNALTDSPPKTLINTQQLQDRTTFKTAPLWNMSLFSFPKPKVICFVHSKVLEAREGWHLSQNNQIAQLVHYAASKPTEHSPKASKFQHVAISFIEVALFPLRGKIQIGRVYRP